jgi:pimeloyl-ACP methyl ester carboxylesterase
MKQLYLLLILLLCFTGCSQAYEPVSIAYGPVTAAICTADTLNGYHYIIPSNHPTPLPLLIILDSGGDGALAVKKVENAVSRFPCFVAGSDLVRNNYAGYQEAISKLIEDIFSHFNIARDQVYIAGFSGGARMAFGYAMTSPVKGVLMCSAGPGTSETPQFPVYAIAGTTDFNFSEAYINPLAPHSPQTIKTDYFRGTHEWPDAATIEDGLLYLMKPVIPEADMLWKHRSAYLLQKADSLIQAKDFFFALKSLEKAQIFDVKNKKAKKQWLALKKNKACLAAIRQMETELAMEQKIRDAYAQASMKNDSTWWFGEIDYLDSQINKKTGSTKDHLLRIKGFLGIMFFSQLNYLIRNIPSHEQIPHILAAYKKAEPDNPDVYYDYAVYARNRSQTDLSRKYLEYAISRGFKDQVRLKNDFPAY